MHRLSLRSGVGASRWHRHLKQDEVTPWVGYTFSEGIDFDAHDIGDGTIFDKLTPTNGFTWGFLVDYLVRRAVWSRLSIHRSKGHARGRSGGRRKAQLGGYERSRCFGDGPLTGTTKNFLTAYRSKADENTKISKYIVGERLKEVIDSIGRLERTAIDSTDSYVASASELDRPAVEKLLREKLEYLETNLSEVFKRLDALEGLLKSSPARKELRKLQNHLDLFELDHVRVDLDNISQRMNSLL